MDVVVGDCQQKIKCESNNFTINSSTWFQYARNYYIIPFVNQDIERNKVNQPKKKWCNCCCTCCLMCLCVFILLVLGGVAYLIYACNSGDWHCTFSGGTLTLEGVTKTSEVPIIAGVDTGTMLVKISEIWSVEQSHWFFARVRYCNQMNK